VLLNFFQNTSLRLGAQMDLGVDSKRGVYVKHVVYDTLSMAAPTWLNCMAASAVQLFCISLISEHGSVAELAALGLSNVFCNISGNSMIWGLAAALDTLSPQALGAGEKRLAGTYCLRAIALMLLTGSVPILSVWLFAGPLLSALGQDPEVVTAAAAFIRWRIPGVLCLPVYVGVSKTMIAMGKTTLPGGVSIVSNLCSAVIAWLLLAKLGWGVEVLCDTVSVNNCSQ
jgi:MATE family multidrug resistance protein